MLARHVLHLGSMAWSETTCRRTTVKSLASNPPVLPTTDRLPSSLVKQRTRSESPSPHSTRPLQGRSITTLNTGRYPPFMCIRASRLGWLTLCRHPNCGEADILQAADGKMFKVPKSLHPLRGVLITDGILSLPACSNALYRECYLDFYFQPTVSVAFDCSV